jgi:hypothetical protein
MYLFAPSAHDMIKIIHFLYFILGMLSIVILKGIILDIISFIKVWKKESYKNDKSLS